MAEDLEDRIRITAYQIWESEGRPPGREALHWDEAKEIVAQEGLGEPVERPEDGRLPAVEPVAPGEDGLDAPSRD